jgi:hypothetical protein
VESEKLEVKPSRATPITTSPDQDPERRGEGEGWETEKLWKKSKEETRGERNNPSKWSWCAGNVALRGQQSRPKNSSVVAATGKITQSHRVWSKTHTGGWQPEAMARPLCVVGCARLPLPSKAVASPKVSRTRVKATRSFRHPGGKVREKAKECSKKKGEGEKKWKLGLVGRVWGKKTSVTLAGSRPRARMSGAAERDRETERQTDRQ